jgi:hypothetical protein
MMRRVNGNKPEFTPKRSIMWAMLVGLLLWAFMYAVYLIVDAAVRAIR